MPAALKLTITTAGRAAIVNAEKNGTAPVLVAQVGLTSVAFTPDVSLKNVPNELKKLATISGGATASDTIHVTIRDNTADTYSLRGLGLYLGDGTLFATYSQTDVIGEKSAQASLLLAIDTKFADINATSLTFGDTNFQVNKATSDVLGLVRLALVAEAVAGQDNEKVVTPAGVKAALDDRLGAKAPTDFLKTLLALVDAPAVRNALALKSAALKDTGAGNGLDADTVDGLQASVFTRADQTFLGASGNVSIDSATITAALWAALPVGYARLMDVAIGTARGLPINDNGYFFKIANRNTGGGWSGLFVGLSNGDLYFGTAAGSTVFATWRKVSMTDNFDLSTKLDVIARYVPGQIVVSAGKVAPPRTMLCNGAALSRATYAALFAAIGTVYGAGDGTTTFNIPSLGEGNVIRATVDPNKVGTYSAGSVLTHTHGGTAAGVADHGHGFTINPAGGHGHSASSSGVGDHAHSAWTDQQGWHAHTGGTAGAGGHSHLQAVNTLYSNNSQEFRAPGGSTIAWGQNYRQYTDGVGDHGHTFTTDGNGSHGHNIGMNGAGAHAHDIYIGAVGDHNHGVSLAVGGAHTHTITIAATGGSENLAAGTHMFHFIAY